jgi:hypothetical protein
MDIHESSFHVHCGSALAILLRAGPPRTAIGETPCANKSADCISTSEMRSIPAFSNGELTAMAGYVKVID